MGWQLHCSTRSLLGMPGLYSSGTNTFRQPCIIDSKKCLNWCKRAILFNQVGVPWLLQLFWWRRKMAHCVSVWIIGTSIPITYGYWDGPVFFLHARLGQWVLAGADCKRRLGKNGLHHPDGVVWFLTNDVWVEQCFYWTKQMFNRNGPQRFWVYAY